MIQALSSHTISSSRSYTNMKFIFIDEAAFFIPSQQDEVRAICEAYRPKSNPFIVKVHHTKET
jgi:thymidine kinase